MKKKLLSSLILLSLIMVMTACGSKNDNDKSANGSTTNTEDDTSLQYIIDRGKLIVGLDDTFPPMGFRDA